MTSRATRQTDEVTSGFEQPSPAIYVNGVSKIFGHGTHALTAIDDLSLVAQPGEFVSILGASGCGKSTLLSIIAGLESHNTGSVSTNDHTVAMMFQEPADRKSVV